MQSLMYGVYVVTTFLNFVLALVLVGRQYYIRWGYLTLWCVSSVILDFFGLSQHGQAYRQYFLFCVYPWTWLMEILVILEARKWGERRIRIPVEFQLLLAVIGIAFYKGMNPWGIYYFECGRRFLNLLVVGYFCWYFTRKDFSYDRSHPSDKAYEA